MYVAKDGFSKIADHNPPRERLRHLGRPDDAVTCVCIAAWLLLEAWSAVWVGDTLLLLMPVIFCCATALLALISRSFAGRGFIGAAAIIALNLWLMMSYPL